MSSIYRDIAEQMASIYRDIAKTSLENASKEQLIQLLEGIKEEAKDSYVSYSVHLGWYDNHTEAENELTGKNEEEAPFDFSAYTAYRFELTDWIAKQKRFSSTEIIAFLEQETDKAYAVFIMQPIQDMQMRPLWIPKSQAIQKEEVPLSKP